MILLTVEDKERNDNQLYIPKEAKELRRNSYSRRHNRKLGRKSIRGGREETFPQQE